MQVFSAGPSQIALNFSVDGTTWSPDPVSDAELNARVAAFRPEMILYRPVADRPALHDCAMRLIRDHELPLAVWIMDDWMDRLQQADPALHEAMDSDLRGLIGKASALFAISAPMAEMLAQRYGGDWQVFSNAIDPADWTAAPTDEPNEGLVIRYAGGLAEDMTLDSLRRIAGVVGSLAEAHPVSLQINTRPYWADRAGHHFAGLRNVEITTKAMHEREYRAWLSTSDAVLIAYNFDPATKTYVQYSMANKLPECLASGAATLAYGPRGIATIDALEGTGCAHVLTEENEEALRDAILSLLQDRDARVALGLRARAHAFKHHDLAEHAERFRAAIDRAVDEGAAEAGAGKPAEAPPLTETEPTDKAILRELQLMRAERFANWIANGASRRSMSEEAALNAGLAQLRQDLGQIQDSMADKDRRDMLLLRKLAVLTDQVGTFAQGTSAPVAASSPDRDDAALNAVLAQLRQDLAQIQEGIVDNERRGALTLKKVAGLVTHMQSIPVNPPAPAASAENSALGAAIAQLHRELTEIRETMADNERRDAFLLRKTTLLSDQVTAPPPSTPAPRKRSAMRTIRRLPARLVRLATGKKAGSSAGPAAAAAGDAGSAPLPNPQDAAPEVALTTEPAATFALRTEWVDLKFDEVGVVLAWSLEGKPIASTMAVRQQDVIELRVESTPSVLGQRVAPFSLIVSSEGRSGGDLVGDLSGRLHKRLAGVSDPASARFLQELNRQLPDLVRAIT